MASKKTPDTKESKSESNVQTKEASQTKSPNLAEPKQAAVATTFVHGPHLTLDKKSAVAKNTGSGHTTIKIDKRISSGKHQWRVKMTKISSVSLGVCKPDHPLDVDSEEFTKHNNTKKAPPIRVLLFEHSQSAWRC